MSKEHAELRGYEQSHEYLTTDWERAVAWMGTCNEHCYGRVQNSAGKNFLNLLGMRMPLVHRFVIHEGQGMLEVNLLAPGEAAHSIGRWYWTERAWLHSSAVTDESSRLAHFHPRHDPNEMVLQFTRAALESHVFKPSELQGR